MKNKVQLSSMLGEFFLIFIYVTGIGLLGFLIYSIFDSDKQGTIASLVFLLFYYLFFFRKIMKVRRLTFDENNLYTKNGHKISFNEVEDIVNGEIIFIDKGVKKTIYVNPYFPAKNHKLFVKYYRSKKSN